MKRVIALLFLAAAAYAGPCDVSNVLSQIRPGEQWFIRNNDYSTLIWLSPTTPPTLAEVNAGIANCPNQINVQQRSDAIAALLAGADDKTKLARAILLTMFDDNNVTREWIASFKAAVAAATTLADLKTRVAALPDMPDRTVQQAKTAVQNKINSGVSD